MKSPLHTLISVLVLSIAGGLADKDPSGGLRQSSVFSSNTNQYQTADQQQSISEAGVGSQRAATPTQNSFGFAQDVQGKQLGQGGSGFGASGGSVDASSSSFLSYPSQTYQDSYSSYTPPVQGGYPNSKPPPSYLPQPQPPKYGQPETPKTSGYGQPPPPTPVYGIIQTPQYGQQQQPAYGQPTYGQQQQPAYGQPTGESYAYHYTHYPQTHTHSSDHGTESGGGHSLFGGDLFGGLSGLGGLGDGLSGFGSFGGLGGEEGGGSGGIAAAAGIKAIKAIKGIAIIAKIAKHFLIVKPFIILGLLLLVLLPFIILFLPIPVITIAPQPDDAAGGGRSAEVMTTYLSDLTSKVLSAEECLERIICKFPEFPEKYKSKAKGVWENVGSKVITNTRVSRGLTAYFEDTPGDPTAKNRAFKCNQKFKCSNKLF